MKIEMVMLKENGFRLGRVRKDGSRHAVRSVLSLQTGRTLEIRFILSADGKQAVLGATWKKGPQQEADEPISSGTGPSATLAARAVQIAHMIGNQ